MHSITDHDLQNYPHVLFTSPDIWDTSVLDHGIPPSLPEAINPPSADSLLPDSNLDAYRDTRTLNSSFCDLPSLPPGEPITHVHMHKTKTSSNFRLAPPQGEDQPHDLTSDVFFMAGPNLDEFYNTHPCPPSLLMTYWGEPYSHLWMRMVRQTNLMSLLTKDHMLPQTQNIMGVPTTYLLNWKPVEQTWETKDNNKWKKVTVYDKKHITNAPKGHKKIRVHFVLDVKYCKKIKGKLVADGYFTKKHMETDYSGIFLAEPNNLELWRADAGHAYNPQCWHHKFYEILHQKGFKPSTTDPYTWMKYSKNGNHHEYIAVYVDDQAIYMEDPKPFWNKLREIAPFNYHLGCGHTRDEDNPKTH